MKDDMKNQEEVTSQAQRGPARVRGTVVVASVALAALVLGVAFAQPIRTVAGRLASAFTSSGAGRPEAGHEHAGQYYTCGMHPWVIQPAPGLCPICKMALTPIDPAKFSGEVAIDPLVVQNIGVRLKPVTTGPLVHSIRTVGSIDYDETAVREINIKVSGWIEKLHVDYLGAKVAKGEALFDLYSPELYSAQEEYLLAWRNRDTSGAGAVPDAQQAAKDLLAAARTRLEYYDITAEQIEQLQQRNQPSKTMSVASPFTGVVIAKNASEGMKVESGMLAYRVADLSKVWVMATLYESDLPFVAAGQRAVMTLPYIPGQTFEGKVIYVYPYLEATTRQVKLRLEFENPHGLLKPGMYANVELKSTLAQERTLAPRSAILDTGERQVAFVSLGEGRFEPREVILGIETEGGMVEVLDGLKPGEIIVVSGQFLLDSESKVREALAKMIRGDMASQQTAVASVEGETELPFLPAPAAKALTEALTAYLRIGDALANDTMQGVADSARDVARAVDALIAIDMPGDEHFWHRHEEAATVRGEALKLAGSADLKAARPVYANLSLALVKLTRATGVPAQFDKQVQELHCPMYHEDQGGGIWLQTAGEVRNPFFGKSMLRCFDKRTTLPRAANAPQ